MTRPPAARIAAVEPAAAVLGEVGKPPAPSEAITASAGELPDSEGQEVFSEPPGEGARLSSPETAHPAAGGGTNPESPWWK